MSTATHPIPSPLPTHHRALHVTSTSSSPALTNLPLPTPPPNSSSALIRVLATQLISYGRSIYNFAGRAYPFPLPLVPGYSAIGRIASLPPDAASLKVGQLVHVDCVITARDGPGMRYMAGVHHGWTEGSQWLMRDVWRDGCLAEYAVFPVENLMPLDEARLLSPVDAGGLGYDLARLSYISTLLVPYGGLAAVGLHAGETAVIAPATGGFGGAAVLVALAMGARVLAMGRNGKELERMERVLGRERLRGVRITGDVDSDLKVLKGIWGEADVFFDIAPPAAAGSSHVKSGILSLRHGGRVCLMGGKKVDEAIPYTVVVHKDLTIKGKWMYERPAVEELVKMVEAGTLRLGEKDGVKVEGTFGLEDWDRGCTMAEEHNCMGSISAMMP
ncbi:MAG: hypothetical protein M1821_001999 [Bathelium mastoideum]|nr:MAG: hypothetical protein M1821_001999 [Bathelium mastoideum]